MAYPKSHNPFADDDDEEAFQPKGRGFDDDPDDSGLTEAERRQRYLQQEVMRTAQSAVDSSYRSIGLIYDSEKMGVETAEVHPSILSSIHPSTFRLTSSYFHTLALFLLLLFCVFVCVGADATG